MTTQRHEIEAWLGVDDATIEWTPEQVDSIVDAYTAWERDTDLPEDPEERAEITQAMLTAIAQHVDGVADLATLRDAYSTAAARAEDARQALIAAVTAAVRLGDLSEYEAAKHAGVTRMTIRSWLGK